MHWIKYKPIGEQGMEIHHLVLAENRLVHVMRFHTPFTGGASEPRIVQEGLDLSQANTLAIGRGYERIA